MFIQYRLVLAAGLVGSLGSAGAADGVQPSSPHLTSRAQAQRLIIYSRTILHSSFHSSVTSASGRISSLLFMNYSM